MAKPKPKYSNFSKQEIIFIKNTLGITKKEDIDISLLKLLKERLKSLHDSRNQNMIIYKLWDVIMCVIIASFADNDTWEDIHDFVVDNYDWFKSFLQMTGGIPTEDSYERIISLIDHNELNNILLDFFKTITFEKIVDYNVLNFDGRVNNGSKRNKTILNENKIPLNCLNIYSNKQEYCTNTIPIGDKTNEIPTIGETIKGMNLDGYIITWDALNSQTKNTKAVINSKGNYIVPIKGNQGTFHKELEEYFDLDRCGEIIAGCSNSEYKTYYEKSHSSIIKYEYFETSDIDWFEDKESWFGIKSIGMVKKTISKIQQVRNPHPNAKRKTMEKEITSTEYRYYISSKNVNIEEFSYVTRNHWNVENKIHWHLDATFHQDNNTTTNKNALLNLEIIHKFILAILNRVKNRYNMSLNRLRKHISNNINSFFPELICNLLVS